PVPVSRTDLELLITASELHGPMLPPSPRSGQQAWEIPLTLTAHSRPSPTGLAAVHFRGGATGHLRAVRLLLVRSRGGDSAVGLLALQGLAHLGLQAFVVVAGRHRSSYGWGLATSPPWQTQARAS